MLINVVLRPCYLKSRHLLLAYRISKKRTIARPNKWSKRRLFKFLGTNKKVEFVIFPFYVSIYPAIFCYDFLFLSWKLDKANSLFLMTFAIPYIVFQGATLSFLILEDENFSLIYILIYHLCAPYSFFLFWCRFRLKWAFSLFQP